MSRIVKYDEKIRLMENGILYYLRLFFIDDDNLWKLVLSKPGYRYQITAKSYDTYENFLKKNYLEKKLENLTPDKFPTPSVEKIIKRLKKLIEKCDLKLGEINNV